MASWHDRYRLGTSVNLAVASSGGTAASTAVFGAQTYGVRLAVLGTASSTAGVRYKFGNAAEAPAADTTSALLPANWYEVVKITPGQRLSAIGNDGSTYTLNIVELSD